MMSYATLDDMVLKFGAIEMRRLSVADGDLPEAIEAPRIDDALSAASLTIDSYLRRRYALPLAGTTDELVRATCVLARYDLATGGDREPSEQMRLARKEVMDWLADLGAGKAELAGVSPIGSTPEASSGARTSDRERAFFTPPGGGL
jgi:phage gp36-like protein